ncbi:hypothetical protein PRZ48_007576 [Zasmidium cellare]|uniref:Uncharacterized protein n=1 Tax=Zasmidium cellare TaxID=395010 RepID=A0ABR0EJP9_ZASCE|nr:hypothetical protein PRZ48_007576 [Zasmidium cellare]
MTYPKILRESLTALLLICLKHILLEDSLKDAIVAICSFLLWQLVHHTVNNEARESRGREPPQSGQTLHENQSSLVTPGITKRHPAPIVQLEPGDSDPTASLEDKVLPLERPRFLVAPDNIVDEIKDWATFSDAMTPLSSVLGTAAEPFLVFRGTSSGKWNKPQRQARRDRRFNEGVPPTTGFGGERDPSRDVVAEIGRHVIPTSSTNMHHGEGTSDGTGDNFSVRGRSSSSESDRVPKKRRRRHR